MAPPGLSQASHEQPVTAQGTDPSHDGQPWGAWASPGTMVCTQPPSLQAHESSDTCVVELDAELPSMATSGPSQGRPGPANMNQHGGTQKLRPSSPVSWAVVGPGTFTKGSGVAPRKRAPAQAPAHPGWAPFLVPQGLSEGGC